MGGIPRGRITEMGGVPTSGMATLALKVMAAPHPLGGGRTRKLPRRLPERSAGPWRAAGDGRTCL
ncbi:MAG: hypothetical protein IPM39_10490 [Chloroflexi bacterium]|nr:hypothetical protein [Chloroflexota bacterium]